MDGLPPTLTGAAVDHAKNCHTCLLQSLASRESTVDSEAYAALNHVADFSRFFSRLAFDTTLPSTARHYAGSLAFYIFSTLDYICDEPTHDRSYLDDLAVAVLGTRKLMETLGGDGLHRHWKGETPLPVVLEASYRLVKDKLPDRVMEQVHGYIS